MCRVCTVVVRAAAALFIQALPSKNPQHQGHWESPHKIIIFVTIMNWPLRQLVLACNTTYRNLWGGHLYKQNSCVQLHTVTPAPHLHGLECQLYYIVNTNEWDGSHACSEVSYYTTWHIKKRMWIHNLSFLSVQRSDIASVTYHNID